MGAQGYQRFPLCRPVVGQNIVVHVAPADRASAYLVSVFLVHSTSFSSIPCTYNYFENLAVAAFQLPEALQTFANKFAISLSGGKKACEMHGYLTRHSKDRKDTRQYKITLLSDRAKAVASFQRMGFLQIICRPVQMIIRHR